VVRGKRLLGPAQALADVAHRQAVVGRQQLHDGNARRVRGRLEDKSHLLHLLDVEAHINQRRSGGSVHRTGQMYERFFMCEASRAEIIAAAFAKSTATASIADLHRSRNLAHGSWRVAKLA
jgi:hypothetical protein